MYPSFNQLKKNIKKSISYKKTIKLAVLGDTATQLLCTAIKGTGVENELDIQLYEADYNQIDLQISNPLSDLYEFKPDFIFINTSSVQFQKKFYASSNKANFSSDSINKAQFWIDSIKKKLSAKVIITNLNEVNDTVYGQFSNKYPESLLYQIRKYNFLLMELAAQYSDLSILDIQDIQNQIGYEQLINKKTYYSTDILYQIEALPIISQRLIDLISVYTGYFKKCLILDLDNTTWGGVIGDDGINNIQIGNLGAGKAFSDLQTWAKQLKKRGIILCVCSKNTEEIAKEPFISHPDMVLKIEDISVFMINWENKVKNIQKIRDVLNIGFDSMVFLDDNPFERNIVRDQIPEINIPELPEDPALYLDYLNSLNLFETNNVLEDDELRTEQYQKEAERVQLKSYYENEDDFLKHLEMESKIELPNQFNIPRIAQLTERSNQFNLRTLRFTENEIQSYIANSSNFILSFYLKDKFGDHGLIALVFLKVEGKLAFIDNWLMSCRVLKRGMENFTLNQVVEFLREKGVETIEAEYLESPKNALVKDHYKDLGFETKNDRYYLEIKNYKQLNTFIKTTNE